MELFLTFFYIMGPDILFVVEESRSSLVTGAINSTFLTLIPKCSHPKGFNDFRPISLCKLIYEVIAKIIEVRLKPNLSKYISKEQFGFLHDRQKLDAMGVAHETFHSIKSKKLKAILFKLDLVKAYDCVDWFFLRLILIQIGLPWVVCKWIMACVSSVNFVVIINGSPTDFFKISRG